MSENQIFKKSIAEKKRKYKLIKETDKTLMSRFHSRQSRIQLMERLKGKPKKDWQVPEKPQGGISYILTIKIDPTQKGKINSLTGLTPILDFTKLETKLLVTNSQKYRRIESIDIGVFGEDFVFITNPDGDLLFLDSKHKRYLQMDQEQIPPLKFRNETDGEFGETIELLEEV